MSDTANTIPNSQPVQDCCIMCLRSFGIQHARIPVKCINVKCGQQYCAQCLQMILTFNGDTRLFRCMYCLKEYLRGQQPDVNQLVVQQLSDEACVKYGMKRTRQLLFTQCNSRELISDIECRWRHLMNLISIRKRFLGQTSLHKLIMDAENMANQLLQIIEYVKAANNKNIELCIEAYRDAISSSVNEKDTGAIYIRLCEDLQLEILEAEYHSIFPKTTAKMNEWLHQQGSGEEFQPKLLDLFKVIEQDLIDIWSNSNPMIRTKIGVIGYTSAGKSSLINRLLGVKSLKEDGAAPVSINKSTFFPLQYDRSEPLIDPDDSNKKTLVTFIDIQGLDKNRLANNSKVEAGNYLDEIRKADCDIYMFVHDEELSEEQQTWTVYIEEVLKRTCVLVRSKVDLYYLTEFQEHSGTFFSTSDVQQRAEYGPTIIKQLKQDSSIELRSVFLVACDYTPASADAASLLKDESFDFPKLLNELGHLAFDACSYRIHALAHRTIVRAINTSFRRGYVLNVMKYKVASGFASIIPFGDQYPRYLSRNSIRDAFGIDDALRQYLNQFHLIIYNYKLQTSVFEKCVEITESQIHSKLDARWVGKAAGTAVVVGGAAFTDDILRVAVPAATALSGAARVAFTVATIGIGVVISAGVSAWSAVDSGKHIFSYINRVCDDTIMVTDSLITSIIERERKKLFDEYHSTADSVPNNE